MKYLLDANVFIEANKRYSFIEANKRYYSKEIVPSFWQFLENDEDIFTIAAVKKEIEEGDDWLVGFIKNVKLQKGDYTKKANEVSNLINEKFSDSGTKQDFFKKADYKLICVALSYKLTIVTEEKFRPNNKITIPNVCKQFNITCIDTFQMLKHKKFNLSVY